MRQNVEKCLRSINSHCVAMKISLEGSASHLLRPLPLSLMWIRDCTGPCLQKSLCLSHKNHIYGRGEAYTVILHDRLSLPLQHSPLSFSPHFFSFSLSSPFRQKLLWQQARAPACRHVHLSNKAKYSYSEKAHTGIMRARMVVRTFFFPFALVSSPPST